MSFAKSYTAKNDELIFKSRLSVSFVHVPPLPLSFPLPRVYNQPYSRVYSKCNFLNLSFLI